MRNVLLCMSVLISTQVIAQPECRKAGEVCVAPNQTRNIEGLSVFRECWEWKDTYECRSEEMVNDCQPLRDRGCAQIGSVCVSRDSDGGCTSYEQTYNCPSTPESYTERTVCEQSTFCQDGSQSCFDTSSQEDNNFAQSVVMMEIMRQAGVYGVNASNVEFFKGAMEECSKKGINGAVVTNCCKPAGGGQNFTNQTLSSMVNMATGPQQTAKMGTKMVYDMLYASTDNSLLKRGVAAMAEGAGTGGLNSASSSYGISFEFDADAGIEYMSLDPQTFQLKIQQMMLEELQQWLSCSPEEQTFGMKRGQNLCAYIDTYCSNSELGVCTTKREKHCCFNSKLAKIINRQGRAQLGLDMTVCSGFSQTQFQSLDFSQMDFSEFIADIVPKNPNQSQVTEQVRQTVEQKVQDYYQQ